MNSLKRFFRTGFSFLLLLVVIACGQQGASTGSGVDGASATAVQESTPEAEAQASSGSASSSGAPTDTLSMIAMSFGVQYSEADGRLVVAYVEDDPAGLGPALEAGADPDVSVPTSGQSFRPILAAAIESRRLEDAAILIEHGATAEAESPNSPPPVVLACRLGYADLVRAMAEINANPFLVRAFDDWNGAMMRLSPRQYGTYSLMTEAVQSGQRGVIDLLLELGVDKNAIFTVTTSEYTDPYNEAEIPNETTISYTALDKCQDPALGTYLISLGFLTYSEIMTRS